MIKTSNIIIILKTILTPFFCWLFIYCYGKNLFIFPLIFVIILGSINANKFKFNFLKSFFLWLLFSYISFFVGYFGSFIIGKLLGSLADLGNIIALIISAFIITPVLLYYCFLYVFKCPITKFNLYVMIVTLLLMSSTSFILLFLRDHISIDNLLDESFLNPFILWQIFMAFSFQLILYQTELKTLFKPKNN